ncbi:phage tail sheath family protein [Paenibacillus senegalensis]|uniref:phage tail sheath family protein n=1 Tax=Paenibacillus senegalensis TaxID=1465766 RepID=UPI000289D3C9|nr:phage tail sheath family protein [Paenibacillus senegalensis]
MAGGTWTTQNKIRPGVYIQFTGESKAPSVRGERGTVTMPLVLSWGPEKQIIEIQAGDNVQQKLGYDLTAPQVLLVKEALKRANKLLLYRVNSGEKARATLGEGITVIAKNSGSRGNDISVAVRAHVDEPAMTEVVTYLSGAEVDTQVVSDTSELQSNAWVDFSGEGALEPAAGIRLSGGEDGTATNQDYMDYLEAVGAEDFHTLALPSEQADLKSVCVTFVRRLRELEGKKIQAVLANHPIADYEGIISVKNGVVLSDGTSLDAAQATAWVAAATAAAEVNQSLTYQAYDDAVDASIRYTSSQIEEALRSGELVFVHTNGRAVVEQDINTLVSFTPQKGKAFSKNRVIRVLDGLANDFKRKFELYYIGKVDNNADGRGLFRSECVNDLELYQNLNAIQNFDPQEDIMVEPGEESDSIYVEARVQPVDAIEKIYMKVKVN